MSDNYYEVLGIRADASSEDIRKAYRKMALQTHPDRLPPGATAEEKKVSEEKFRKANNAYEILIDPKNRKLYDLHGVWPPPKELPDEPRQERNHHSGHRHSRRPEPFDDFFNFPPHVSPFGDPFAHHYRSQRPPVFRDPFETFNDMFADMHHDLFHDLHPGPSPTQFPLRSDVFLGRPSSRSRTPAGLYPSSLHPMPMFHPFFDFPVMPDERPGGSSRPSPHRQEFSFQTGSREYYGLSSGSGGPQFVSETRTTRTVNGVTQSVWKAKDREGNKHVTYTYPDGREEYTVNGVAQPPNPRQNIQDAHSMPVDPRYTSPPPFIPPEQVGEQSKRQWWKRH